MSVELVEVEVAFAGIEAIEVEIVSETTPGIGSIIVSETAPSNPINGLQWMQTSTNILSFWSASESAWIVPAAIAIPSNATRDDLGAVILDDAGNLILFAAAA